MKKFDIACVIDDDEIYTFTVKRIINNSEIAHKTLFFPNGKLALDFFTEYVHQTDSLPDLILLDINMPVLDGWQFMDEFVKIHPLIKKKVTIYIVSSSIDEADFAKARSYEQISDFIVKPINVAKLQKMVEILNEQV
jgi:CheY-like chemotaxis protein